MAQDKYLKVHKVKHYPSGIKEWPNNLFLYNKNELKNVSIKNKLASRIIKSYFNLSNDIKIARSKRMRALLKRLSSKRLFISKVEIKGNNDKYSLNIYVYNRIKQYLLRKIYMFNRNKFLYNTWKKNKYTYNSTSFLNFLRFNKKRNSKKFSRSKNYFNIYLNNHINSYLFKFKDLNKIASIFFYKVLFKNKNININPINIIALVKNNIQLTGDKNKLLYFIQKCYKMYYKIFIHKINNNRVKKKILLNKALYTKFIINQFKFNKFIPKLKMLLENIFNKKIELNIVDLKYIHMNSDIFIDSLTSKIEKRISLAAIFRKSLYLAKTPKNFINKDAINFLPELYRYKKFNVNDLHGLYKTYNNFPYFNKTKNTDKKDILNEFLLNTYTLPLFYQGKFLHFSRNNKHINMFSYIKYKWLSGIRLEAAGRLTRRFTASRSVHFLKYKGNLKHVEYNRELSAKNNLPVVLLRNIAKANSQYTLGKSKKRIGAFGVKGWISSK